MWKGIAFALLGTALIAGVVTLWGSYYVFWLIVLVCALIAWVIAMVNGKDTPEDDG